MLCTYLAIFNWQMRSFSLASSVLTSLQDSFPPALFCSEQWLVNMKLPILDVTRPELLEPKLEFCEYPEESSHEAFGPESKDGKARPEKVKYLLLEITSTILWYFLITNLSKNDQCE